MSMGHGLTETVRLALFIEDGVESGQEDLLERNLKNLPAHDWFAAPPRFCWAEVEPDEADPDGEEKFEPAAGVFILLPAVGWNLEELAARDTELLIGWATATARAEGLVFSVEYDDEVIGEVTPSGPDTGVQHGLLMQTPKNPREPMSMTIAQLRDAVGRGDTFSGYDGVFVSAEEWGLDATTAHLWLFPSEIAEQSDRDTGLPLVCVERGLGDLLHVDVMIDVVRDLIRELGGDVAADELVDAVEHYGRYDAFISLSRCPRSVPTQAAHTALPEAVIEEVQRLVDDLSARRFHTLVSDGRAGRLDVSQLESSLESITGTLAVPEEAWLEMGAYAVDGAPGTWAIDIDLWADGERTDLTLEVTVRTTGSCPLAIIDNLRVL
ncbi:MAG: hypothetical protein KC458_01630 [Dehalococcoidia bacterium]|nr:hypothetical protein [Dehalococcoidia bacterium]